jgi:hypothetical protein
MTTEAEEVQARREGLKRELELEANYQERLAKCNDRIMALLLARRYFEWVTSG